MIRSVSFLVLTIGEPSAPFKPSQGIQQGDPLSLYLFVICSEGFSALITWAEQNQMWKGISFDNCGLSLTYLFFANDNMLFNRAIDEGVTTLKEVFHTYEFVSSRK